MRYSGWLRLAMTGLAGAAACTGSNAIYCDNDTACPSGRCDPQRRICVVEQATRGADGGADSLATNGDGTSPDSRPRSAFFVRQSTPAPDAENVPRETSVTVTLSAQVSASSLREGSFVLRSGGQVVPAVIKVEGPRLTLTPRAALRSGTVYEVTLSASLSDRAGNALETDHVWSFATLDDIGPQLLESSPDVGQSIGRDAVFVLRFDEAIDPDSVNEQSVALMLGEDPVTVERKVEGAELTLTPESPLALLARYELRVSTAVSDLAGNAFVGGLAPGQFDPQQPQRALTLNWSIPDGRWTPAVVLSSSSRGGDLPGLHITADDRALVAWRQSSDQTIHFREYQSRRNRWTLDSGSLGGSANSAPQVGAGSQGNLLVVWQGSDSGATDVRYASYHAGQDRWSGEQILRDLSSFCTHPPLLASTRSRWIVVFSERLCSVTFVDGVRWSELPTTLANDWSQVNTLGGRREIRKLKVDADRFNGRLLFWEPAERRYGDVELRTSAGQVNPFDSLNRDSPTPPGRLLAEEREQIDFALPVELNIPESFDDPVTYVWTDRSDMEGRIRASDGARGAVFDLSAYEGAVDRYRPTIATNRHGTMLAAWFARDFNAGVTGVEVAYRRRMRVWSDARELLRMDGVPTEIAASVDAWGHVLLVWDGCRAGRCGIWGARRADQRWSAGTLLHAAASPADLRINNFGDGSALVLWSEVQGGGRQVYGMVFR